MKKIIVVMLALALTLPGMAALAEDEINCLIDGGAFVIQVPNENEDMGWVADDMAQDDSVVTLYDADTIGGTFVARYEPAGDGDVTVGVRHYYSDVACDEKYTWDLHVEGGAVQSFAPGIAVKAPDEAELDPMLIGEWEQAEAPFSQLSVEKNLAGGWDMEVVAPLSQGAYVFMATACYDCELNAFVYDKGKYWEAPITDSEETPELGEPSVAGTCGSFTLSEDGATLTWYDDQTPENTVAFARAAVDTSDWAYYSFEGSNVAMKLPPDFTDDGEPPAEGIFYQAGNADVVLQVLPVEGDFADRDALMEYFNNQEYVVRSAQLDINGIEFVYSEGADDGVMAYSTISPEGTTYCFAFIPQSDHGEAVIQAMTETICQEADVPE